MQKKIIALAIAAAFAAPVTAMAVDSVTVYGVLDGGVHSVTTNGSTSNTMSSFYGLNSSRFGVKASEDLGDGMKANVVLEGDLFVATGVNSSNGGTPTALFSRQSTVGLSSDMGAIDMGHQYTTAFKVNTTIDPFGHQFIGITSANAASGVAYNAAVTPNKVTSITRNDNDIAYTGKFGGVTVFADRSVGGSAANNATNAATTDAGATTAVGVTYVGGPIIAAASYSKVKSANTNTAPSSDMTHYQVGAGFNFGAGKVMVGYADQKNQDTISTTTLAPSVGNQVEYKNIWIGGNINVGDKVNVTAAHYRTTTAVTGSNDVVTTNTVAAVTYALSKKTALYVEADKQTSDVANASDTNGYGVGLNVAF